MKISEELEIAPGEIWAVTGPDAEMRTAWCARLARREDLEDVTALLSFAQHAGEAQRTGWPQARYYEDEGKTVADFLSYDDVWEINPFEVGAKRPETRKAFRARQERILRLLDLRKLWDRLVIALSNGETRRVLLARALAKGPRLLVLDDPAAGMDVKQRAKLKDVVTALAARGMSVIMACRHADELPEGVAKGLEVDRRGAVREVAAKPCATKTDGKAAARKRSVPKTDATRPPVVEIRHLDLAYGGRTLFRDFSWTVRQGERWILRGENGSGKTTLMALVTGDSPLAYAADVRVFGMPREVGVQLSAIRRRIGMVSPEMQAYLGKGPEELIEEAVAGDPELLILDEPFMNLDEREAKRASRRIGAYLKAHPQTTAILICHRNDEAPRCFDREMELHG